MEKYQKNSTHLSIERIRHGEGGRDPAISVDDMRRQPTDDALDRSPDILRRCDDERTSQKQHGGEDVVQPEEHIVRVDVLDLEVSLESSKQLIHVG